MSDITTHAAKKVVQAFLDEHKLTYTKLSARTIDFIDLARAKCVFVTVHGWVPIITDTPEPTRGSELAHLAIANGFRVEFA